MKEGIQKAMRGSLDCPSVKFSKVRRLKFISNNFLAVFAETTIEPLAI